ncbi:hypothetical protein [Nocardioides sambongensis]|uniref:hypothetical protein n=1 Tax=Nocardioides sambongensis TaxID=2589074 RepID=UPI001E58350F|nr:hypothetical protein [Nocardioides sambongensis]
MSEKTSKNDVSSESPSGGSRRLGTARVRGIAARVVWALFLAAALVMAAAAFSFALDANGGNALVRAVRDLADVLDLGLFDLDNPVWEPGADAKNALVKTALANYGAAAVAYLVVGRVVERIIRP